MRLRVISLFLASLTLAIGSGGCSSGRSKMIAGGSGGNIAVQTSASGGADGSGGAMGEGGMAGSPVEGGWQFTNVQIPSSLAVPASATLKTRLHAIGVQIYACVATAAASADAASTFAWTLKAPDAKLFDGTGLPVGKHSLGPTWVHMDGSLVVGAKVAQADSPDATAIPWLLLRASAHSGGGILSDVTFVQRVNTALGKAPATGCGASSVGDQVQVDYLADYYFYAGADDPADAGTDASWSFTPVVVPAPLMVPDGAVLKLRLHATGVQIYTCAATPAVADGGVSGYAWTLKAPDAVLYDQERKRAGTHGQGPTWTATDGSSVVGAKRAQVDSPDAAAIPWLLLGAASHAGAGLLADVTFVQRLNTAWGKAPAVGCDATHEAAESRADYAADYYFYSGGVDATDAAAAAQGGS